MKKYYLLLLILFTPLVVDAKTVTCTTRGNVVEGKNVYNSISVSCTEGSTTIFAVCEVGSSFDDGAGGKTCNVHDPYNAIAGKKYALTFSLSIANFGEGDTLVVDGDTGFTQMAQYQACSPDSGGCLLSGKNHTAAANQSSQTTTKKVEETTTKKVEQTTTKAEVIHVYWVSYDVNGGKEEIKQEAVEEGKTATKPTNPTREGYTFDGWYLNDKAYDFNTKITGSITLKAKWKEVTTGKENIPFIKLTGLLAPYEGEKLDNDLTIETYKPWDISMFNVGIEWYRSKDKNKIDERVYNLGTVKAEEGYYYQVKLILTPGEDYTLNNTKVYLTGKKMTTTKDENKLIVYSQVYGPIKKGVSADPLVVFEDYEVTINSGKSYESMYSVSYLIKEHDDDAEKILLGPNCIRVTNPEYFSVNTNFCGTNEINTNFTKGQQPITLTFKGGNFQAGQILTTDVILTDINGKTYAGTYTFRIVKMEPQKVGTEGDPIIAEFLGETEKNWYIHAEDLTNKDMGMQAQKNISISGFKYVGIENITVSNEDGEKRDGEFTIKILLTEEMKKYKNFSFVYAYGGEGYQMGQGPEIIKGHVEGDYLVARLPHLSKYVIFGKNDTKEPNKNIYYYIGAGLIILLVGVVLVLKKKPKKAKKKS